MIDTKTSFPCISFIVPGKPKAKARPRSWAVKKNGAYTGKTVNYTPESTRRYECIVRDEAEKVMEKHDLKPLVGLVAMQVKAYWQWPKSSFRKTNPRPETLFPGRLDADNNLKIISDAINNICYLDDKQVVIAKVEKWRAKQGDPARVEVKIWSLDNEWPNDLI